MALFAPVLILLLAGVIDLGRAFYYEVVSSAAAREGTRLMVVQNVQLGYGGLTDSEVCTRVEQDLGGIFNVVCPYQPLGGDHAPPYSSGTDFTPPAAGQAYVILYPPYACTSSPCRAVTGSPLNIPVYTTIIYGFTPVMPLTRSFAPSIVMQNYFEMKSDW